MEDIWDATGGRPDTPHRHNYYTIVFPLKAKGEHVVDFASYPLIDREIFFVSPGQVHQVIETEKSVGYALTFSQNFMMENAIEQCFIDDLSLFKYAGEAPPLSLDSDETEDLKALCESMISVLRGENKFKYQALGALLKLFLIRCNNVCALDTTEHTQNIQASVSLLRSFKTLIQEHFAEWHKVQDYADHLHITPDYLNTSVKAMTGRTAKDHIQARLIIEAKRLLKFTDLSAKEIAYTLGFSEAANFSQFFKKRTGLSPSKFAQS
jgi:AraC-like DNA-binding protein